MADAGRVKVYVEVEGKGNVKRDLNDVRKIGDKTSKSLVSSFKASWLKIAAGAVALKKAIDFAIVAKNAARDAKEINSKFLTVFESIQNEAKLTAQTLSESFGLARSSAEKLLSSTGDLLVGFGFAEKQALELSNRVSTLAIDLASFTNFEGGATRASEALTKAILGETESAKSLGIVIRQNTKEFRDQVKQLQETQGLTAQQAKAIIILDEAYKQSSKAIGDFARTQDQLANQERIVNERYKATLETIGNGLVPVFIDLTKAAGGWLIIAKQILGITDKTAGAQQRVNALIQTFSTLNTEALKAERDLLSARFDELDAKIQRDKKLLERGVEVDREALKLNELALENLLEQVQAYESVIKKREREDRLINDTRKSIEDLNKEVDDLQDKISKEKDPEIILSLTRELTRTENKLNEVLGLIEFYKKALSGVFDVPALEGFTEQVENLMNKLAGDGFGLPEGVGELLNNIKEFTLTFGESNARADVLADTTERIGQNVSAFGSGLARNITLFKQANSVAQQLLNTIVQTVAQIAIAGTIKGAFNLIPGVNLAGALFAGGGSGTVGGSMTKAANGASGTIPGGFPNDSFPFAPGVMAQSGEQFAIANPARGQSILDDSKIVASNQQVAKKIDVLIRTLAMKRFDGILEVSRKNLSNAVTSEQNQTRNSGRNINDL